MHNLMKLTIQLAILTLVTISLTACLNSTRTKYRSGPTQNTNNANLEAERDRLKAERDALQEERDALKIDFGDDFSGSTTTSVTLAAVTRVQRNTGQTVEALSNFNPHQLAGAGNNGRFSYGSPSTPGMRNPEALAIRTDAQLYPSEGNPMLFARTGASTLEFPGRGDVFRAVSFHSGHGAYQGTASGRLTRQGFTPQSGSWRNWEHTVLTSFQFTRSGDNPGLVMKFGADENGGAIFSDLESYAGWNCGATNRNCNAPNTHDISIGFGANRHRNPTEGALAYYWRSLVPNHHLDRDGEVLVPGETVNTGDSDPGADPTFTVTDDVGSYTLELTHAATSLEDAADDDADRRYLSYAAYGLFNFFDKYADPTNGGRLGRMQTISYGFDAFADDEDNMMRTTDLGTNIEATFKGRTMAYLLHLASGGAANDARAVTALTRMRGDIQLMANIGPNAGSGGETANSITGTISGLEYYTSDAGQTSWRNTDITTGANTNGFSFATIFGADGAALNLTGGTIDADGSYAGTVTPSVTNTTFIDGTFKGNFYGPRDGLETAGTWYLPAADTPVTMGVGGIIGSFGACQDDQGRC